MSAVVGQARCRCWSPLLFWHGPQQATRLLGSSRGPPKLSGTMWSALVARCPQYPQAQPSRASTWSRTARQSLPVLCDGERHLDPSEMANVASPPAHGR